ncbi:MAG TPA: hypothetical protein DEG17_07415 [Cyanobacteria bacterium UBA11149]|nr:hypothetical protein [Cyanobacteria bacterium UBA11367]HBE55972.1 hypothetical protein [Cyanobacteria bacterium UBA11366]HBK63200.1 hypothetical protein [Cyanobacteria bacterium UBA11166]HBR74756.1 hypothetical protein [Cyanobacteria bacterium UBA11159]HBS72521.1 hypothetical protein [Cyanobacteria bacterium UBA11153]HBW88692.1 hypothetical protein [Cyanobacteria bacterium UBA11149]HCA94502.1 hypothetical protein [Cyanobacteria bacterium UBA9226]
MEDSIFIIFLGFSVIWIILGVLAWLALIKADNQKIEFGKWGLLVAIPILIPFIFALVVGAVYLN